MARRIDELLEAPASAPRRRSGRRFQARSLISKPIQRRRELGDALLLLIDHRRRRAADEALVGELGVAPWRSRRRGDRSPWRGARVSAATSIFTCSASRVAPTHGHRCSRCEASANAASSANSVTSDRRASDFSSGVASPTKSASPIALQRHALAGRQAHLAAQVAARCRRSPSAVPTQASASASTRSSCAFG